MEYKIQAVKLAKELGGAKAAAELGIPENTMYAWTKVARKGRLNTDPGSHTPQTAMNLAQELILLRRQVKEQEKEIRRLKEKNEFLAIKTKDSIIKGKFSFYCRMLKVTRPEVYKYLTNKDHTWKY